MFVDFFGCCMDQIFDQGAKLRYMFGGKAKCPLVIRTQIGAGVSAAGQHSGCHYSVFTHMPGIKTVVPSTPADAKGLLLRAIRDDDLVMFFENKVLYGIKGEVPEGTRVSRSASGRHQARGDDVTIVAISRMVSSRWPPQALAAEGIEVEVIDPRTLSPLDEETILNSVAKTHRLVIVDEDNPRCSAATDIAAMVADKGFDTLDAPIKMVTAPHTPVPFSPPLEQFYVPSPERIADAVREIVYRSETHDSRQDAETTHANDRHHAEMGSDHDLREPSPAGPARRGTRSRRGDPLLTVETGEGGRRRRGARERRAPQDRRRGGE